MKINKAIVAGHVVQCFDNTIYGFFSVLMAPIFFGSLDSRVSQLLASYGAFAAGFIAAPLGAVLFGLIGDKYGRRVPLLLEFMCVGIPTITIGFLPGCETIGVAAPILLVICRILQGFFYSAEYAGINVYNYEDKTNRVRLGQNTGLLIASGSCGAIVATVIGSIVTDASMPYWCWRIPFVVGGLSAFAVLIIRTKLTESEEYGQATLARGAFYLPYKELFMHHKLKLLCAILIVAFETVSFYSATIYSGALFQEAGYSVSSSMKFHCVSLSVDACSLVMMGKVADKVGINREIVFGLIVFLLFSIPVYALIASGLCAWKIYVYMFLVVIIGSMTICCGVSYAASLFPLSCRYSAVALADSIGSIFGGITPMIIMLLTDHFHSRLAILVWVYVVSIPCLITVVYMNKRKAKL
jgi:MHS family proline/betaine transporter-like MFS transporter